MRIERSIVVNNELGLHARPAAMLVREANSYDANIFFFEDGSEVSCKSVLSILMLSAAKGRELLLVVEGDDAETAAEAIVQLFIDNFGEDEG